MMFDRWCEFGWWTHRGGVDRRGRSKWRIRPAATSSTRLTSNQGEPTPFPHSRVSLTRAQRVVGVAKVSMCIQTIRDGIPRKQKKKSRSVSDRQHTHQSTSPLHASCIRWEISSRSRCGASWVRTPSVWTTSSERGTIEKNFLTLFLYHPFSPCKTHINRI